MGIESVPFLYCHFLTNKTSYVKCNKSMTSKNKKKQKRQKYEGRKEAHY